MANRNEEIFP